VRELLVHILGSDPQVVVIGTAANGAEAVAEAAGNKRPDVITMDVQMPKMNGLDATRRIMEVCPTPIVVVSSSSARDECGDLDASRCGRTRIRRETQRRRASTA
jgi:two-component system chemotaxis response regulator CheB